MYGPAEHLEPIFQDWAGGCARSLHVHARFPQPPTSILAHLGIYLELQVHQRFFFLR